MAVRKPEISAITDPAVNQNPAEPTTPAEINPAVQTQPVQPKAKILLADALAGLEEMKLKEVLSITSLKMEEIGHIPVENALSAVAATMMSVTGVYLDDLTVNVEKLQSCFPQITGIWRDSSRSAKDKLIGIAATFDAAA